MNAVQIDQLEKELMWIFVHVPWNNLAARQEAVVQTIRNLRALRAKAEEGMSKEQAQATVLACSGCGKELPLVTVAKQRFCSKGCKQRHYRRRKRLAAAYVSTG